MTKRRNLLYVIAIDQYESAEFDDLSNPVLDANAIIALLTERYGFELFPDPLFNAAATKENIYQGFNSLLLEADLEDNVVIYFSGHGRMHLIGGQGYWVPHESKNRIDDFIENSVVKDYIERINSKHTFLIADSCFSGTFLSRTRSAGNIIEYASLDQKLSRWMMASGSEETVSDGAKGKHSPFARYLIRFLSTNDNKYASVLELIRYVTVMTENNSKQHPNGAPIENIGHAGGQMIFVLKDDYVKIKNSRSRGLPWTVSLLDEIKAYEAEEKRLPSGKEILLIQSFVKQEEVMIVELFRFDDDGNKKLKFSDGALKMTTNAGEKEDWNVIHRFATWQGLTRFWDEHGEQYDSRNPIVLHAHESIDSVEESNAAIEYSYVLKDLYESNPEPQRCLHCGEMISTNESAMVEIDEDGLRPAVGNVHAKCLRPLDRIIGKASLPDDIPKNLVSFDAKKWIELLRVGQFHWHNALTAARNTPIWTLTWNREHIVNTGDFCIRQVLSNGTLKYVRLGKEIQRFPANKIDEELEWFENELQKSIERGDPVAFTEKQYLFGTTSEISKRKEPDEKILNIIKYEKVKYSRQIESENIISKFDYAPVGLVVFPGTMQIVNFGNCIPLIFDPTQFEILHKNWNEVGYTIGPCAIRIIESDREFDLFLMNVLEQGMQPIVHPIFDNHKELISGAYIQDIRYFTEGRNFYEGNDKDEEEQEFSFQMKDDPEWKEGDLVRVKFPGIQTDKFAEGVLLTDEFVDEKGESCIIFGPMENGKQTEMKFKMPVKLLERI